MSCFLLVSQDLLTYLSSETFFTSGTCSKWYRKTKLQSLLHFSNAISKWSRNIFFSVWNTLFLPTVQYKYICTFVQLFFKTCYAMHFSLFVHACGFKSTPPPRHHVSLKHYRSMTAHIFHCQCNGIITPKLFRSFKCFGWSFRSFPVCSMIYNAFHTFPVSKLLAKGKRYICTHYTCIAYSTQSLSVKPPLPT